MATYALSDQKVGTGGIFYGPLACPYSTLIDVPTILTDLGITAFGAADILEVFGIDQGFLAYGAVVDRIVAEGATCTIDVGWAGATDTILGAASAAAFLNDVSINTTGRIMTLTTDTYGASPYQGALFETSGATMDVTFNTAATETAVFSLAIPGWQTDCKAAIKYRADNGL
jgi:hypothetical protein